MQYLNQKVMKTGNLITLFVMFGLASAFGVWEIAEGKGSVYEEVFG
ncbi:MAG: hypothetical protein ABEJ56_05845 [Candidatus Nanohaloarchaea archaeon]